MEPTTATGALIEKMTAIFQKRPVLPGTIVGKGQSIRLGKHLAFIEGTLFSASENVLARAPGTAFPTAWPSAKP